MYICSLQSLTWFITSIVTYFVTLSVSQELFWDLYSSHRLPVDPVICVCLTLSLPCHLVYLTSSVVMRRRASPQRWVRPQTRSHSAPWTSLPLYQWCLTRRCWLSGSWVNLLFPGHLSACPTCNQQTTCILGELWVSQRDAKLETYILTCFWCCCCLVLFG